MPLHDGRPTQYSVDALVFAKVRGWPYWPARVDQIPDNPQDLGAKGRYTLFFFGSHDTYQLGPKDLYPFDHYKAKYGVNTKRKYFAEGMYEIENEPHFKPEDTGDSQEISDDEEDDDVESDEETLGQARDALPATPSKSVPPLRIRPSPVEMEEEEDEEYSSEDDEESEPEPPVKSRPAPKRRKPEPSKKKPPAAKPRVTPAKRKSVSKPLGSDSDVPSRPKSKKVELSSDSESGSDHDKKFRTRTPPPKPPTPPPMKEFEPRVKKEKKSKPSRREVSEERENHPEPARVNPETTLVKPERSISVIEEKPAKIAEKKRPKSESTKPKVSEIKKDKSAEPEPRPIIKVKIPPRESRDDTSESTDSPKPRKHIESSSRKSRVKIESSDDEEGWRKKEKSRPPQKEKRKSSHGPLATSDEEIAKPKETKETFATLTADLSQAARDELLKTEALYLAQTSDSDINNSRQNLFSSHRSGVRIPGTTIPLLYSKARRPTAAQEREFHIWRKALARWERIRSGDVIPNAEKIKEKLGRAKTERRRERNERFKARQAEKREKSMAKVEIQLDDYEGALVRKLKHLEMEVKRCLSVSVMDLNACALRLDDLYDMPISQSTMNQCSTFVETMRKCGKFGKSEVVRTKAKAVLNKVRQSLALEEKLKCERQGVPPPSWVVDVLDRGNAGSISRGNSVAAKPEEQHSQVPVSSEEPKAAPNTPPIKLQAGHDRSVPNTAAGHSAPVEEATQESQDSFQDHNDSFQEPPHEDLEKRIAELMPRLATPSIPLPPTPVAPIPLKRPRTQAEMEDAELYDLLDI